MLRHAVAVVEYGWETIAEAQLVVPRPQAWVVCEALECLSGRCWESVGFVVICAADEVLRYTGLKCTLIIGQAPLSFATS